MTGRQQRHDDGIDAFFFFNDTATTEIYTLSLHDALPIYWSRATTSGRNQIRLTQVAAAADQEDDVAGARDGPGRERDRKSTRLNSSHANISYAVFCLKKKKNDMHWCLGTIGLFSATRM